MITREQFIAGFDQELASVRDRINSMLDTYGKNMDHVAECDKCSEVDNVTALVMALFNGQNKGSIAAYCAVAIKMLYDERTGRNGDLP